MELMSNNRNPPLSVEEEFFCVKFELKALSNLTIKGEAERWVPGYIWPINEKEHISRYELAANYVRDKKVLDIACGSGYGSYLLAKKGGAVEVLGCDLDSEAIRYGDLRYFHQNVSRSIQDAEQFNVTNQYDVAISFETIEHLDNYTLFLQNVHNSLKTNGILIISTPIVDKTHTKCYNPYHKIEWSFNDFQKLISHFFTIQETYIQSLRWKEKKRNRVERFAMRVLNRIRNSSNSVPEVNPFPELYSGKNESNIKEGYQIIICKKI